MKQLVSPRGDRSGQSRRAQSEGAGPRSVVPRPANARAQISSVAAWLILASRSLDPGQPAFGSAVSAGYFARSAAKILARRVRWTAGVA